ncbi:MAG: TonB-dependent receptor [Xanthomonadaceae bacterium]|nr:TonB-dependent receptor [Xanthomonadaceae bacterium]
MSLKRRPLTVAVAALALAIQAAFAAEPASLSLVLFDDQMPLPGAEVRVDDQTLGQTDSNGASRMQVPAGARRLTVLRDGREVLSVDLNLSERESAEVIATLYPDAAPGIFIESSHGGGGVQQARSDADAGPPGELSGRIVSAEDGAPVAGARVFVSGTPLDVVTDADGRYRVAIQPGSYAISVIAPRFGAQTLVEVPIASGEETERNVELTPAGLELPEFVVLEPFIEGSLAAFVEERRSSSAVADILGAEQIARAGDSDAAGALKRVTGLTLVDGKFVFVRGLGERYSSVLFNGAQIPSPDPTRRVVPLDLFPTSILQGVVVQKTFTPDMPGEFGGGTIQLRTVGVPESPFFKISLGGTFVDGTTFSDGLTIDGGGRDFTGFDDGTRAEPDALRQLREEGRFLRQRGPFTPDGFSAEQIEAIGEDLISDLNIERGRNRPNGSLGMSGGYRFDFGQDWSAGFIAAMRYGNSRDNRDEIRRVFQNSGDGLALRGETELQRSIREYELSGYAAVGIEYADLHKVQFGRTLVRQTEEELRITTGEVDSQVLERNLIEWIENDLKISQGIGEHRFPLGFSSALQPLELDWLYTEATAGRYAPNSRNLRFDFNEAGERLLSAASDGNEFRFEDLGDDSRNWEVSARIPLQFDSGLGVTLGLVKGAMDRERDSFIRRFSFGLPRNINPDVLRQENPEDIFSDENIGPNGFALREVTSPSDTYFAEQNLDYRAATLDLNLFDRVRLVGGVREEDNLQRVTTFSVVNPNSPPVVGTIEGKNLLPSAGLTWWVTDKQQFRLGYSETLSRPDFREQTPAQFLDPILDQIAFGNADLRQARITNYDARWEYYFSPTESLSFALFRKEFEDPIEKQIFPGGGSVLVTLANAESATNQGVELDLFKSLDVFDRWIGSDSWLAAIGLDRPQWSNFTIGANYAWIDSEVTLDEAQSGFNTNLSRPLEGQSRYVVNLQLGYEDPDGRDQITLLYNTSGARISQVGVDGAPDILEQPFGQLDFSWRRRIAENWRVSLRLRNLLDPKSEFTQGPETVREFKKGRELGVTVEWSPF